MSRPLSGHPLFIGRCRLYSEDVQVCPFVYIRICVIPKKLHLQAILKCVFISIHSSYGVSLMCTDYTMELILQRQSIDGNILLTQCTSLLHADAQTHRSLRCNNVFFYCNVCAFIIHPLWAHCRYESHSLHKICEQTISQI